MKRLFSIGFTEKILSFFVMKTEFESQNALLYATFLEKKHDSLGRNVEQFVGDLICK